MTPILICYNLAPNVFAFSTTRHGGVSKGNYGELNINPYCGDDSAAVNANTKLLAAKLGITESDILLPHQIHSTKNVAISDYLLNSPKELRAMMLEGVDSLTCDKKGTCIGVSTADCIPVLLYDPKNECTAAIHAGWRGTVQRIVEKTVKAMEDEYGTNPADLRAVIGPGISLKNFEVGKEVYLKFKEAGFDMTKIAKKFPVMSAAEDGETKKWHIDLPLCNQLQLERAGVLCSKIHQCGICTYDNVDTLFSARRLGADSGRIYTGIIMRS